jgi:hypothetical protein
LFSIDGSFIELNPIFDDDGKVVGTEGNNSRARCGSVNDRVLVDSDGDFHGPKIYIAQEQIHISCQHPRVLIYELSILHHIHEEDLYFVSSKECLPNAEGSSGTMDGDGRGRARLFLNGC